ncbi:MAG: hypothetical protein OQK44_06070, partial [Gammaproteobacteria bacterium]|nr:hypothetical protein [Gammaproteobacteria bacterium]
QTMFCLNRDGDSWFAAGLDGVIIVSFDNGQNWVNELKKLRLQIDQNHQRSTYVTSGSAAIVGASVIYALADSVPMMLGAPVLAWLSAITGVLLVINGLKK